MRLLALVTALLALCGVAQAQVTGGPMMGAGVLGPDFFSIQPIFSGGLSTAPSTSVANFFSISSGYSSTYQTTTAAANDIVPVVGYFRGLYVDLRQNVGGSSSPSYTVALFDASVATALSCTVASGASTCSNDTVVPVAVNDKISWGITPSGTPNSLTSPPGVIVTALFVTGNTHYRMPIFMGSQSTVSNSAVTYIGPGRVSNATEIKVSGIISGPANVGQGAGAIQAMYAAASGAPGATSKTYIVTMVKNGTPSTITCTITDPATTCNDTSHTVNLNVGDTVSCKVDPNGTTPTARNIACGLSFNPNNNNGTKGYGLVFENSINALPTVNSTQFIGLAGNSAAIATEANIPAVPPIIPSPHTITFANLIAAQDQFSATATRGIGLRSAGVGTGVALAIPTSGGLTIGGVANTPADRDSAHSLVLDSTAQPLLNLRSGDSGDTGSALGWFKSTVTVLYQ
jgi:hypothetical protein